MEITREYIKAQFPAIKNNVAFFSPDYMPTHEVVIERIWDYYHREQHDKDRVARELIDAKESVARLINAEPDQIKFIPNMAAGFNAVKNQWTSVSFRIGYSNCNVGLSNSYSNVFFSSDNMYGPEGAVVFYSRDGFKDLNVIECTTPSVILGTGVAAEWIEFIEYHNLIRLYREASEGFLDITAAAGFSLEESNSDKITIKCEAPMDATKVQKFLSDRNIIVGVSGINNLAIRIPPFATDQDVQRLKNGLENASEDSSVRIS